MLAQKAWRMIRTLIFTYLVSGVLLTALAFALYKFRLPESQITLGISGVYILSCFMGGFMAGKGHEIQKIPLGAPHRDPLLYLPPYHVLSPGPDHHRRRRPAGHGLCHVLFKRHGRGDDQLTGQKKEAPRSVSGARALFLFSVFIYFQLLPWHRPPEPEDRSQRKYRPCPAT